METPLWYTLKCQYPDAVMGIDIRVLNYSPEVGIVDFQIAEWNLKNEPIPTEAQLSAWAIKFAPEYAADQAIEQLKVRDAEIVKELDDLDMKSIRYLRTNDNQKIKELEDEAIVLRGKLSKNVKNK